MHKHLEFAMSSKIFSRPPPTNCPSLIWYIVFDPTEMPTLASKLWTPYCIIPWTVHI